MNKEAADGLQLCVVTLLSLTIRGEAEDGTKVFSSLVEEVWNCFKQLNTLINLSGATGRLFGGHFGQGGTGTRYVEELGRLQPGISTPRNSILLRPTRPSL